MLSRGPPDPRYIPERVREPTYIRKKYVIWARWCPVDTAIGRRGVTRTHYSLVVRDGEPVATGQVLGVAPPVNAVVGAKGASAPPAPSGFCTQCGAPMASDARFCGSCGAAR